MTVERVLEKLAPLVGTWTTEATHRLMPGVVIRGTAAFEWLEGRGFLIHRSRPDHPDFPQSIAMIGPADRDRVEGSSKGAPSAATGSRLSMHCFDSRGVHRVFEVNIDDETWRCWRDAPGFSQRFTVALADGGDTIRVVAQLCTDDVHWIDDLELTYRRSK